VTLPVLSGHGGDLQVPDPDTGEVLAIRDASDRALATAAREIADLVDQLFDARRALAAELRDRHGDGTVHAGGHAFTIKAEQSWGVRATGDALARLIAEGEITQADADRAMPRKPAPDKRAIKALISRLVGTSPAAAQVLADAGTVSPASLRDVRRRGARRVSRSVSIRRRVTDIEVGELNRYLLRRRAAVAKAAELNARPGPRPVEYRVVRRGGTWAVVAYQAVLEQRTSDA
jgi:hypothetical protein